MSGVGIRIKTHIVVNVISMVVVNKLSDFDEVKNTLVRVLEIVMVAIEKLIAHANTPKAL